MSRIGSQFRPIALAKLRPLQRVGMIPPAQFIRGSYFFQPDIEHSRLFGKPARPQPIDENAYPILGGRRVINAFYPNRHCEVYSNSVASHLGPPRESGRFLREGWIDLKARRA